MRKSRYLKIAAQGAGPKAAPGAGTPRRGFLVLVDGGPVRTAATRKYKQTRDRFAEAQALLARFQEKDKPKFERWLQERFRGLVTDLRQKQGELNRLRELIFEVETRTWFNNQSCAAAYRDVLDRKARRHEPGAEGNTPEDDLEEKMRAHLEAEARDEREEAEGAGPLPASPRRQLSPDKEARLKAAYRAMARRLHPDRHATITPQMRERWHEAQQAYLAGDVDLLESIESLCHDEEAEVSAETPVSSIQERTGRLAAALAQLANKMQHARKDPAWAFSVAADVSKIERIMAKTLPVQIESARREIAELEEKIAAWRADAERFYPGFKESHPEPAKKKEKPAAPKTGAAKGRGPARPAPKGVPPRSRKETA